jgi:3-dehydroquinate dehydratase type I
MSDGKVCISIQAPTIKELIERAESAVGKADLTELRFDFLDPHELGAENRQRLSESLQEVGGSIDRDRCITTFRPKEYGGHRAISENERANFWNAAFETRYADLEEDLLGREGLRRWSRSICSLHDFQGVPSNLDELFERLKKTGADILKFAAHADDVTDAIPVWRLLERREAAVIPMTVRAPHPGRSTRRT